MITLTNFFLLWYLPALVLLLITYKNFNKEVTIGEFISSFIFAIFGWIVVVTTVTLLVTKFVYNSEKTLNKKLF